MKNIFFISNNNSMSCIITALITNGDINILRKVVEGIVVSEKMLSNCCANVPIKILAGIRRIDAGAELWDPIGNLITFDKSDIVIKFLCEGADQVHFYTPEISAERNPARK